MTDVTEAGRLLHDRLVAAAEAFFLERGRQPVNVVVGAFLSCAIQAAAKCSEVDDRTHLVLHMVTNIVEHCNAPVSVKLRLHDVQHIEKLLLEVEPQGRA
jgi:hypothetical protein